LGAAVWAPPFGSSRLGAAVWAPGHLGAGSLGAGRLGAGRLGAENLGTVIVLNKWKLDYQGEFFRQFR